MIFHLADFIPLNERDVLTLFRLPTFVMISGCLFNVKSGMLEFVKRKVKTLLLVPFAFFYTITCVIVPFILLSCFGVKLETYLCNTQTPFRFGYANIDFEHFAKAVSFSHI